MRVWGPRSYRLPSGLNPGSERSSPGEFEEMEGGDDQGVVDGSRGDQPGDLIQGVKLHHKLFLLVAGGLPHPDESGGHPDAQPIVQDGGIGMNLPQALPLGRPVAGLLPKLPGCRLLLSLSFHHASRKLQAGPGDAVAPLAHQNDPAIVQEGEDLDPVRSPKHQGLPPMVTGDQGLTHQVEEAMAEEGFGLLQLPAAHGERIPQSSGPESKRGRGRDRKWGSLPW